MQSRCAQPVNCSTMSGSRAMTAMLRAVCMVPIAKPGPISALIFPSTGHRFVTSGGDQPRHILGGRGIFALKAAAAPAADAATPSVPILEPMELPTSDESDKLLWLRHSVSMGFLT
jgi:hypothetical protein